MAIHFYHWKKNYGWLSNYSPHGFHLEGRFWPTVEHYYQAHKFSVDSEHFNIIAEEEKPGRAKNLTRKFVEFVRDDWDEIKDKVMYKAVLVKFSENPAIKEMLIATGDQKLVEQSPTDLYWGVGVDNTGLNKLGKILQRVRSDLNSN